MRVVVTALGAAALLLAAPARAQEAPPADAARSITLTELVGAAVQRSPDLKRARADIGIAEAGQLSAEGLDDWTVTGSASYLLARRQPVAGQFFQTTAEDTIGLGATLARPLSTGGSVGIDLSGTYSDSRIVVSDPSNMAGFLAYDFSVLSGRFEAVFEHPLLRGRGRNAARAPARRAKLVRSAAALAREAAASETIERLARAYWELYYAQQVMEIRRASLELARKQLELTRLAIADGARARVDALAVEQAIAVRQQALILAEIELTERALELRTLAGMPIGPDEVGLVAADALPEAQLQLDQGALLTRALADNPRLEQLRAEHQALTVDVEVEENASMPALDFSLRGGPAANAASGGDAVEQIVGLDAYTVTANLTYRQSIGNRAARGDLARARELRARNDEALLDTERDVAARVVRAFGALRAARARIDVAEVAVELAEQNLDAEKTLFGAGKTRNFDVVERQNELAQAQLDAIRARVDHRQALIGLQALTGTLLADAGVELTRD